MAEALSIFQRFLQEHGSSICISFGSSLRFFGFFFETKWPYLNPCNLNTWSLQTLWMTSQNILSFSIARKDFHVSFIAGNTCTATVWEYFIWWSPCSHEKILLIWFTADVTVSSCWMCAASTCKSTVIQKQSLVYIGSTFLLSISSAKCGCQPPCILG